VTRSLYTFAVVAVWLISMAWLVTTKVVPALRQGTPPDYRDEFAKTKEAPPPPVAWDLFWNDKPIGMTVSRAYLAQGEPSEIRFLVQFENLEVREVLRELLGGLSFLAASIFGNENLQLDMTIATRLRLDWDGELQGFDTVVKAGDAMDLLALRGQRTEEDRLRISAFTGDDIDESAAAHLAQEFNLPSKTRMAEAFSPRTRMQNLWVGQKWTTPVVNPLATSGSVRLVESSVEKRETITWHDQEVETFLVVYRYDAGSGSASRTAVGKAWVRDDGLVVRQELPIGNAAVRFERTDDARAVELAGVLEGSQFDQKLRRRL